ncbi:universal stress protein [soil metagenome]
MRPERMVVAVDDEEPSALAVRWAAGRAATRPAEITLVTSVDLLLGDPEDEDARLDQLTAIVTRLAPSTPVTSSVIQQPIVEGLDEWTGNQDLFVIGVHSARRLLSVIAGATPYRIAVSANCPVVIVPSNWTARGGPVIVGLADDDSSQRALLFAANEALLSSARLEIVHAGEDLTTPQGEPVGSARARRSVHRDRLHRAVDRVRAAFPLVQSTALLEQDGAVESLIRRSETAGLIVLGTRRRTALSSAVLGSVARELIYGTLGAPIVVVASGDSGAAAGIR